jgi:SPP1 family phage portal protein
MVITDTQLAIAEIAKKSGMSLEEIIRAEVDDWLGSEERNAIIQGALYYRGKTEILKKLVRLANRSNVKRVHSFAKELTDQKIGYLLSQNPEIVAENAQYQEQMNGIIDMRFFQVLRNTAKDAVVSGKAFWHIYIDADGEFAIKKYRPWELLPLWADDEHTKLSGGIRVFERIEYVARRKEKVRCVDYISETEIRHYTYPYTSDSLRFESSEPHFLKKGRGTGYEAWQWGRTPLICVKYNDEEQSLVEQIRSLIDDYDRQASKNSDILADLALIIYVLKGYGGQDLGEFVHDLVEHMAMNIDPGTDAGVDTIQISPDTEAVEALLTRTRQEIYKFGRGVDVQDEDLGNASGVAIKLRYNDLDLDCNMLEAELQSSIEQLEYFIKEYLFVTGKGDYRNEDAQVTFRRNVIVNEKEIVEICAASKGVISDQTIMEHHPWRAEDEEERLAKQEKEALQRMEEYQNAFSPKGNDDGNPGEPGQAQG